MRSNTQVHRRERNREGTGRRGMTGMLLWACRDGTCGKLQLDSVPLEEDNIVRTGRRNHALASRGEGKGDRVDEAWGGGRVGVRYNGVRLHRLLPGYN